MLYDVFLIAIGLVALYFGAEWLVLGSTRIAVRIGISPLVVGLTIVALGTSSPELFVCINLNLAGHADMALGNVVGSNICNLALILGISAVMRPIVVKAQVLKREMPILVLVSGVLVFMLRDGLLSRLEGIILVVGIVIYTADSILASRRETNREVLKEFESEFGEAAQEKKKAMGLPVMLGLILLGLVVLYFGAKWLEIGAVGLARQFNVSEAIISLTLIAIGTSLPELATSIVASMKKEGDIITGNAVGSSIYNILCVLGVVAIIRAMPIGDLQMTDLVVMVAVSVVVIPMMWTRMRIGRTEGILLLLGYAGYCVALSMRTPVGG